jgi:DNA primase
MPLRWREVTASLDPGRFTLASAPRRMARLPEDPMAGALSAVPDLLRALAHLGQRMARVEEQRAPRPRSGPR